MNNPGQAANTINIGELLGNSRIGPLQIQVFILSMICIILYHFNIVTELKWTIAPLDEASTDGGKRRELSAEQRSSRPATDDQDVYRVGEACGSVLSRRCCRVDVGVTGPIAIEIELHACLPSEDHYFGGTIRCRCHLNANAEPSL